MPKCLRIHAEPSGKGMRHEMEPGLDRGYRDFRFRVQ